MSTYDELFLRYFPSSVSRDLFGLMCGELIGSGIGRTVYACAYDKTCVVKIENAADSFQNIHEWDLWQQHARSHPPTNLATEWLAPCVSLSGNGIILIQKRTKPVPFDLKLPKKVPAVLTDLKRDNWGVYKGRLVCHDYGRHDAVTESSGRTKKADWVGTKDGHFEALVGMIGAPSDLI